jgi:uncharacterized protein YcfL
MKKIIIIIVVSIALFSCSSNDESNETSTSSFKRTITNKGDIINEMYITEYKFDSEGKVIKEINTNQFYPVYNSISTFKYDNQGRVIKEIRNNEVNTIVEWNGNVATLYGSSGNSGNSDNALSYIFSNNKVIETHFMGNIHKFNYDANDNVISEVQADTVFVEYLDYDTTVANPMQLIKSIGVLRMHLNPYFKNFFQTKKNYPEVHDDYSTPMQYFQFERFVNSENKIIKIDNNETHYISKFEYN